MKATDHIIVGAMIEVPLRGEGMRTVLEANLDPAELRKEDHCQVGYCFITLVEFLFLRILSPLWVHGKYRIHVNALSF